MLRKLAIAIAASGAMMSASTTYALGMGDIELDSALNQPLDARIELLKASELEDWELKPNLASREEFDKSGVERIFFLNSFRFEIERIDGGIYINITSEQPVVEPYLNFLVQIDWPSGRLLREYTVLLDPPVFTSADTQAVSAPEQDMSYDNYEEEPENTLPGTSSSESDYLSDDSDELLDEEDELLAEEDELLAEEDEVEQEQSVKKISKAKTYAVRKNDTLWEVAIRTRESRNITPQQAMLAIQDLNPRAFINGNINRLKKNQILRVPSEEEMMSRSFSEAVSEVAMQNQAIEQRKAQLDATRKDEAVTRDNSAPDARLKLLAGGDATTEANRGASGKVTTKAAGDQSSLDNDLNLALENLDKSNLENNELRTRLDSLEDQINTLQRLINLKDEQMVALQTGMSGKDTQKTDVTAVEAADQMAADEAVEKNIVDAAPEDADLNFADTAPADTAPIAADTELSSTVKDAAAEASKVAGTADLKPKLKPKPKPKPVFVPPVEEPFDIMDFASENPEIPGALIAALLGGLLLSKRAGKRKENQEEELDGAEFNGQDPLDDTNADLDSDLQGDFEDLDLGDDAAEFAETSFDGDDLDGSELDDFDTSDFESADSGLPDSLDDADLAEGQDVLGEVDVYMAYNRLEPAKDLLEKTLQQQPGRMELRVKLLEVLAESGEQDGFDEQFEYVVSNGEAADQAEAQAIKGRFAASQTTDLSSGSALGLEVADSSGDDFELELDADAGELNFDLDGLDLEVSDQVASSPLASEGLDQDGGLDFDMDLSDFETAPLDSSSDVGELSADNDLDFSSDLELGSLDEDNDLDFSSDLELGSLDEDSGLDFETSLSEGADDFEIPSLTESSPGSDLEFEGLDIPSLETSELDIPSLNDEVELGSIDDIDGLSELSELESASLNEELDGLDALSDSIELDLDDLDELSDLDDLASLDNEFTELDESLDLSDIEDLSADSELEAIESLTADADAFDSKSAADGDLVSLDELGADDVPELGDLDLDNLDEDLDFLSGTDESETKLDLARAYIDMDDKDGAKEILQEVLEDGTDKQKEDASKLMDAMA
jgi:pilus assembly protein FimV